MKRTLILALLVLAAGCNKDDPVGPVDEAPLKDLPFPDSPTQAMANFVTACERLDAEEYAALVHPDFRMVLQEKTRAAFPDLGPELDRDQEVRIAGRMFGGETVTDPDGEPVPPVTSVAFLTFQALDVWTAVDPGDPVPGNLAAPYEVRILFSRGEQYTQMEIAGQVRFYLAADDSLHEGEDRSCYRLSGQIDLTEGDFKAVERATLGGFKALYR